jgi:formate hydrogenlyase transcriptional activator
VDAVPQQVFVLEPDGRILYVNQRARDYAGIPLDDTLTPNHMSRLIHPDELPRVLAEFEDAIARGVPLETEARWRHQGGCYRWFLTRLHPLRDQYDMIVRWYGTHTDIEERKQAEDRVREQEIELRQVLNFAPQNVAVYGHDGERLFLNQSGLDYFGLSLKQWRAEGMNRRVHPEDLESTLDVWRGRMEEGTPGAIESRLRRNDGQYRWFLIRASALRDEQGRVTRWYVSAFDIEDRKQAEERLKNQNVALREEVGQAFEEIIGTSEAIRGVIERVSKVAPTDSTVLITGETGTGKELVARAVHKKSPRAGGPFISVNCAAIPTALMNSELFGHEKGAFTGALQRRLGRFEMAEGGTIFLDEIGDLPAETQSALLRVLQERELERVGGSQTIPINVRVIAATNRNLNVAMAEQHFRSDLFYRLNVFPIEMPPLRDRRDDISLLVEYFIHRFAKRAGKKITSIDERSLELLNSYPWPGNIRELQNVVERSIILSDGEVFSVDGLSGPAPGVPVPAGRRELVRVQAHEERKIIEDALAESHGRVSGPSGAAAKLGIPSTTLESKIKSLKIDKHRFKSS